MLQPHSKGFLSGRRLSKRATYSAIAVAMLLLFSVIITAWLARPNTRTGHRRLEDDESIKLFKETAKAHFATACAEEFSIKTRQEHYDAALKIRKELIKMQYRGIHHADAGAYIASFTERNIQILTGRVEILSNKLTKLEATRPKYDAEKYETLASDIRYTKNGTKWCEVHSRGAPDKSTNPERDLEDVETALRQISRGMDDFFDIETSLLEEKRALEHEVVIYPVKQELEATQQALAQAQLERPSKLIEAAGYFETGAKIESPLEECSLASVSNAAVRDAGKNPARRPSLEPTKYDRMTVVHIWLERAEMLRKQAEDQKKATSKAHVKKMAGLDVDFSF